MVLPSPRSLAVADIDEGVLRQLIAHGEELYIERKVAPPKPPGFGDAVGSLANTLGGFVLLGVADDGTVEGWRPPGRSDAQAHLGELLRRQLDPLPPYVAKELEIDGKPVTVVRVFESADSPHVTRGSGSISLRSSKGKEPVDDHQTVLALAQRGREAEARARQRMAEVPSAAMVFGTPDSGRKRNYEGLEVIVRAAPLTVTPATSDWPLTEQAAMRCRELAGEIVPDPRLPPGYPGKVDPYIETLGRATFARAVQPMGGGQYDETLVLVDSAGVFSAGIRHHPAKDDKPYANPTSIRDDDLSPLATCVVGLLEEAEAIGRAAIDVWVLLEQGGTFSGSRSTVPGTGVIADAPIHASREITIPANRQEIESIVQQWYREIQRSLGEHEFEPQRSAKAGDSEENGAG